MNWKSVATGDLEKLQKQKQSLENLCERINILEDCYTSLKSASIDAIPSKGGSTKMEDALLGNIVEREKLKNTYGAIKRLVLLTEKGLAGLDNEEKRTLELFFIHRQRFHVDRLMEELGYEKTKIYEIKERALYNFTTHMYGLIDF